MTASLKRHEVSPDQGTLFSVPEILYPESTTDTDISNQFVENTDPYLDKPGISVNLRTRAHYLNRSLEEYGEYKRLGGLGVISEVSSARSRELERRYGSRLPEILQNGEVKADRSHLESKRHFAFALGSAALVEAGLISVQDAKVADRRDFDDFTSKYFGNDFATKRRSKFKRVLKNQLKELKSIE